MQDCKVSDTLKVIKLWLFNTFEIRMYPYKKCVTSLHSLYCSSNIVRGIKSRRLRLAGHVARMEEGGSTFKILTGKLTGEVLLGRPRCTCEYNIRMDHKEIGMHTRNWVDSGQDMDYWRAVINAVLNLRVP